MSPSCRRSVERAGRVGGTDSQKDTDIKVRFRGDLCGGNVAPDSETRTTARCRARAHDPTRTQLGLRAVWDTLMGNRAQADAGLKWRNSIPWCFSNYGNGSARPRAGGCG